MAERSRSTDTRHVISINDLENEEIEQVFSQAKSYLSELGDQKPARRIARSANLASSCILATLFYEPSTRTRLSFESAMARLGGKSITSADPRTSSVAKGETLADSVRVISNYADLMVIRHPKDGAARLAAEYSSIPVINGGDGSHEHPTQTLCDLFTLTQKNKSLKDLNIAISGDLKGSRTIHSFVYALARFGANIALMPAEGMELPPNVDTRLREEFGRQRGQLPDDASIDAWYIGPDEPNQLSLIPSRDIIDADLRTREKIERIAQLIHFMYVTRFQKERSSEGKKHAYPKINSKFLEAPRYSKTSVLHPLPRVDELDLSFDTDRRAMYFQQAAYGVPVRMALITLLLDLKRKSFVRYDGGFRTSEHAIYDQPIGFGIACNNGNCITHDEHEKLHARNKFYLIRSKLTNTHKLRCVYCESDIEESEAHPLIIARKSVGDFSTGLSQLFHLPPRKLKDAIIFENVEDAARHGFKPAQSISAQYRTAG